MVMPIRGEIHFPGDKSISHRALMVGALTNGISEINNLSTGADVTSTRNCLELCGVTFTEAETIVQVTGSEFQAPEKDLYCGNSGTTARLLTGLLSGRGIHATLTGDSSLSSRPMNRIVQPLQFMGARIQSRDGKLPVRVYPGSVRGFQYLMPVHSAQVKSAIIFAAIYARFSTVIHEPIPTRDHTERLLSSLGVGINKSRGSIGINPVTNPLPPFQITVPGDPSTAAFFATAAAIVHGSEIVLMNILKNKTRVGFYDALESMGGDIKWMDEKEEMGEPIAHCRIRSSNLKGMTIKDSIPSIIDELPLLAILATQAEGRTTVRNARELRYKESDRIHGIVSNLKLMGARVEELDDGFVIDGPVKLQGSSIKSFGDHRIAMAFSIAGLISEGPVTLDNSECVQISFPEFFSQLDGLKT